MAKVAGVITELLKKHFIPSGGEYASNPRGSIVDRIWDDIAKLPRVTILKFKSFSTSHEVLWHFLKSEEVGLLFL